MNEYSCRKCHMRNHCIDQSENSSSIKLMVRNAFDNQTDTLATWARLQKNCLLLAADQERSTSALNDRLRQVRTAKKRAAQSQLAETGSAKKPLIRRLRPLGTGAGQQVRSLKRLSSAPQPVPDGSQFYWLIVNSTKRRIALPVTGRLALGRFDPNIGIPPDIDLSYEDRGTQSISRRHAAICVKDDRHIIEDLGSKTGVFLNDTPVENGPSRPLKPGDCIKLGRIQMVYDRIPADILEGVKTDQARHILVVTPSGRRVTITPHKKIIIGRADPTMTFKPELDLGVESEIAHLVSRRHARILWRKGQPFVEDLGSRVGTRLGGELLTIGQTRPLRPGDHIWLGGCVVAYDIEM